jgi:hypothetical protein
MNHIPVLNHGICCHRLDWFLDYFTAGSKLHKFGSTEGDSEPLTNYNSVRILKAAFVVYQKHPLQLFFIVAPCMLLLLLFLFQLMHIFTHSKNSKGKGKAIPLQAWTGPQVSRMLRLPDFKTIDT